MNPYMNALEVKPLTNACRGVPPAKRVPPKLMVPMAPDTKGLFCISWITVFAVADEEEPRILLTTPKAPPNSVPVVKPLIKLETPMFKYSDGV